MELEKLNERAALISISAYLLLSISKLIIGYLTNSKALLADGLNNSTDIVSSLAIFIGLKISKKPPDLNHPYGHRRAETIASLIASFIMMVVGIEVLINASKSIIFKQTATPSLEAAWVALFSAIIMFFVYRYNLYIAKRTSNLAVKAAAKDNLSDALVSIGAAIGIIGSQYQLPWLDPVAAIIVGLVICKTAWEIFSEASHLLTDGIDVDLLAKLHTSISQIKGVRQIRGIKGRYHGNELLLDIDITVDPHLNVIESHKITELIEQKLLDEYKITHIQIHVEPEHIVVPPPCIKNGKRV
jgi:cation diffusion facilitator family transporter